MRSHLVIIILLFFNLSVFCQDKKYKTAVNYVIDSLTARYNKQLIVEDSITVRLDHEFLDGLQNCSIDFKKLKQGLRSGVRTGINESIKQFLPNQKTNKTDKLSKVVKVSELIIYEEFWIVAFVIEDYKNQTNGYEIELVVCKNEKVECVNHMKFAYN